MDDFARLLEQEMPRLRRYAHALVRDPGRADDLVQDCLERALRKAHLWARGTSLQAWLFTLLHNLHANAARRWSRSPRTQPLEDSEASLGVPPGQPHAVQLNELHEALGHLPEEQRQVVLLVGMEQLTYKEVADVLDIPVGTVMSRLSRGRERLRTVLAEAPHNPALRRVK